MPTTARTVPAKDLIDLARNPATYLALAQIGTTMFDPAATIEAVDKVGENSQLIDSDGTDVAITVWFGIDRAHAMTAIIVDLDDPITVEIRPTGR